MAYDLKEHSPNMGGTQLVLAGGGENIDWPDADGETIGGMKWVAGGGGGGEE